MAHMTKNLINHNHAALIADNNVTGLFLNGANDIYKGLDLITSDYAGYPKPFINVTFDNTLRNKVMSSKGRYETNIVIEYVEDQLIENDQMAYFDNLEKIQDVLTADAQYNPTFSGEKAFMLEDAYEETVTVTDTGLRITTITMQYQYDKIRT
jgi:hypothetical protein